MVVNRDLSPPIIGLCRIVADNSYRRAILVLMKPQEMNQSQLQIRHDIRDIWLQMFSFIFWACCLPAIVCSDELLPNDFLQQPTWEMPSAEEIQLQLFECLEDMSITRSGLDFEFKETTVNEFELPHIESVPFEQRLEHLANVLAEYDERIASLVASCRSAEYWLTVPEHSWLMSDELPEFAQDNLRLYLAQKSVQHRFFDEALALLDSLVCEEIIAPDVLLFCRTVSHHYLVQPELVELNGRRLLEREEELPVRYRQLAGLMLRDVDGLTEDSLDHIARRMGDIGRRLNNGNSGDQVQEVERGVIESLDKMIEELEEMQQQMASSAGAAGGSPSGTPMQDSILAGGQAPGKVDQREVGNRSGWGDLPPKEREQAMQQIGREFPSHYREIIQQYFRELANESSTSADSN